MYNKAAVLHQKGKFTAVLLVRSTCARRTHRHTGVRLLVCVCEYLNSLLQSRNSLLFFLQDLSKGRVHVCVKLHRLLLSAVEFV